MKHPFWAFCLMFAAHAALAQGTYDITNSLVIRNHDCTLTRLCAVMPVPESNIYQDIEQFRTTDGEICRAANNDNMYLRTVRTTGLPVPGDSIIISERFSATLYPMRIDMAQFTTIYPYDTSTELYKRYTSPIGSYVDITHPDIVRTADSLWNEAVANPLEYARLCYEHVAARLGYLNPDTGIHTITEIMAAGGGDCGNISAVYASLLRCKGVPARFVVTVRPDGTHHVWNDFFLERYGWVPVDVTMKHDHPDGDFFGYCAGDGIVMSFDLCSELSADGLTPFTADLLQTFFYWYRCSAGSEVSAAQRVDGRRTDNGFSVSVRAGADGKMAVEWSSAAGATGYRLSVSDSGTGRDVVTQTLGSDCTSCTFDGLQPERTYDVNVTSLRRYDNIVADMASCTAGIRL